MRIIRSATTLSALLRRKWVGPSEFSWTCKGQSYEFGTFAAGRVILTTGARFDLDLDGGPGDNERVSLPHPEIFQALSPGVQLLLDDGKVRLEVEFCSSGQATTRVLVGGAVVRS